MRSDEPAIEPAATRTLLRPKLWHLVLLVAFVAIAITEIRNHRRDEPALLILAGVGFAGYAAIAWLAWAYAGRFEKKAGKLTVVVLYLSSMAGLFFVATLIYLAIEGLYLGGRF